MTPETPLDPTPAKVAEPTLSPRRALLWLFVGIGLLLMSAGALYGLWPKPAATHRVCNEFMCDDDGSFAGFIRLLIGASVSAVGLLMALGAAAVRVKWLRYVLAFALICGLAVVLVRVR
jgi:hypothetical protein